MYKKKGIILCSVILAGLFILSICYFIFHEVSGRSSSPSKVKASAVAKQSDTNKNKQNDAPVPESTVKKADNPKVLPPSKNTGKDKKVVYLTIDDGPTSTTGPMLDILKKYDVKATFFVIGNQIKGREDLLKRMRDEGHSIGLHSYTHDIKRIYPDQNIFMKEMIDTANIIDSITGIKPVVLRFPGGSGGHLNKDFLNEIHKNNFKVYDWTISSGDGMYPHNTPEQIYQNAIDSQRLTNTAILLMHSKSNTQNSCAALPKIIEYYKNNGYEFDTITNQTPEYYYHFKGSKI